MKPEAQRIAIAEACGWTEISERCMWGLPPGADDDGTEDCLKHFPDYLNSLDAMHEAEKVIKAPHKYNDQLELVVLGCPLIGRDSVAEFRLRCATAAQRAESFLRTLNLWIE